MGTPKGKSGKFPIYPPFQRPTEYSETNVNTTCWGHSCCKNTTVPYFPFRPLQFIEGSLKRAKVENFLYIFRSSGPRRVQRHQCTYTTCWGRSCCKKTTVPYLPIRLLYFTGGGQKSAAPIRVNKGPRHILETIRARKLKFYVRLERVKCTFGM